MSLNVNKLEKVNPRGGRINARCPACAETGNDNKGQHLLIDEQGRFSCVKYPGDSGIEHRKRIFALVGIKNGNSNTNNKKSETRELSWNKVIKTKKITSKIIKSNVLGRLGRVNKTFTHTCTNNNTHSSISVNKAIKGVPAVPAIEKELKQSSVEIRLKNFQKDVNGSDNKVCLRCGRFGERFLLGTINPSATDVFERTAWGWFCLECEPHHF